MLRAPWIHTGPQRPCPACGRVKRGNRCILIPGQVAQCYYAPSKHRRNSTAGECWLHFLNDGDRQPRAWRRPSWTVRPVKPASAHEQLDLLARRFRERLTPDRLEALSRLLGLGAASLDQLDAGWSGGERMFVASRGEQRPIHAWSFPRRDARGNVIGLSMRPMWGRKFAWTGSGGGLHVPRDFAGGGRAYLCEGPSDTAAALHLGLNAFGRSSCSSDVEHVRAFVRLREVDELVIFSQRDAAHYRNDGTVYYPAQDGAEALAAQGYVRSVRIVMPPYHFGDKDVRDWVRRGATRGDVERLLEEAQPRQLSVLVNIRRRPAAHR